MGSPGMLYLNAPVISKFCVLTLLHPGGGKNLSPDETHVISPEPNIRLTPDHPVNSYLSVSNQGKKTRALHLSRFNFGGPIKCKSTFFLQGGTLAKLSKFEQINNFSKNCRLFKKILRPYFESQGLDLLQYNNFNIISDTFLKKI